MRIASIALILAALITSPTMAGNTNTDPAKGAKHMTVEIKTSLGTITLELDAEKAPETVANFIQYANDGFYNGTIFHRVIPGFMIQGGGFEPGMTQKETRANIKNEADNGLKNDKYTIAMARTPDPHSASSQFFINGKDNDFLNFTSPTSQGWGYAVFGKVIAGEGVVEAIEQVRTGSSGGHQDVPVNDVIIDSVTVKE
ncbi:MAG TPA: peptidyl-prolyl cis-trans isomerase [Gammaproteobacteria bacterium]|nr:peptidyl-prolyl cis-trans isomerase [Gammaproteobacteria bacterium]